MQDAFEGCDDEIKNEMIEEWIIRVREALPYDVVQQLESCQSL